jgi:hypothetical protein
VELHCAADVYMYIDTHSDRCAGGLEVLVAEVRVYNIY